MSVNFNIIGFNEPFDMHINLHAAEEEYQKLEAKKEQEVKAKERGEYNYVEEKKEAIRQRWAQEEAEREKAVGIEPRPLNDRVVVMKEPPRTTPPDAVHKAHQDAVDRNNRRYPR